MYTPTNCNNCANICAALGSTVGSCEPASSDAPAGGGSVTLPDPLGIGQDENAVQRIIGRVINALLGIVGSLALVMFIYGGFLWMTAAGNKEGIEKGKNTLTWATLGLVVVFSAYALLNFVFTKILGI